MEYFSIRSFRPFETKSENTDQDRTVMPLLDGFLALPIGALCSGPEWQPLWGITDLPARMATALAGANPTLAHFVTIRRGNHVLVVVWSLSLIKPLGVFYVTAGSISEWDFEATDAVTVAAPNTTAARDKNVSAPWYASRIGDRWFFGNGRDDNVQWTAGALSSVGPASAPVSSDLYNPSRERIPPCTTFVLAGNRSIFAAGNAALPRRVWITHPPTKDFPLNDGVYSLETSFIDLTYSEASRVTALTAFNNYVTAHTDAKPVNMFDVDGTNDGWKCVQAPGAANCSAPNPAAVRDTSGIASFYLGTDGEVYEDQAIRVGPHDKRAAREQDIATRLGASDWNRDMQRPVAAAHTIYDRTHQLFWVFAELAALPGRFGLWAYNERSRGVMGPFTHFNPIASAAIPGAGPKETFAVVATGSGQLLYANLSNIGETQEFLNEAPNMPLFPEFEELTAQPTPTPGLSYVALTANSRVIKEVNSDGTSLLMVDPWSYFETEGTYTFTRFFNNAYVARFETEVTDFGTADMLKNYLELRLTFQHHSRAYVGFYAEADGAEKKIRGGKWYGLVFDRQTHRIPLNLLGRRIRVRGVVILFNDAPAMIRDVTIGWMPAGST